MKVIEDYIDYNLVEVNSCGHVFETDQIVCPYCGVQWEADYGDTEGAPYTRNEYQCPKCGEYFLVDCEPVTEFVFTSIKYKED